MARARGASGRARRVEPVGLGPFGIDPALAAYADAHTAEPAALLVELERETAAITDRPIMLSGRTVGRLLSVLAGALRPRLVVDVGTFTGYSALCLAEGVAPGGRVVTCEVDRAVAAIAQRYFARSPHRETIELRLGPALDTIRALDAPIDLAFIDADKDGYWAYYDAIVDRLAPHGVIVIDNTLLFGSVIADEAAVAGLLPWLRHQRAAILDFNRRLQADPRTEHCLLTVRDGVTLIRRRSGASAAPRSTSAGESSRWGGATAAWAAAATWADRSFAPCVDWLCHAARLGAGDRVLDLASGTGVPALAAARRVAPGGTVLATDLVPEMLGYLAQRASAAGLGNLATRVMDASALDLGDGEYDAVTCAFGLMFVPDPRRVAAEIHRVLRRGGRFAVAVWDEPAANPAFSILGRRLSESIGPARPTPARRAPRRAAPKPRPGTLPPGPFRLAPPGHLAAVLRAGKLRPRVERVAFTLEFDSVDQYLEVFVGPTGPVPPTGADLDRARAAVADAARPFLRRGRLRVPASALCAAGTR